MQLLLNSLKILNKRTNCEYDIHREKYEPNRNVLNIYVNLPQLLEMDDIWYYSKCRMSLRFYLYQKETNKHLATADGHIIARIEMVNHERDEFKKHKEDIIKDCINRFKVYDLEIENIEVVNQMTMPYVIDFKITNI